MIDKIILALESMQEDMEEHGELQKARGVSSAIWLIEIMRDWADRKTESNSEKPNNSTSSKMEQVEDEPQTCEECEYWNDTEDGCADRHGCKIEPQIVKKYDTFCGVPMAEAIKVMQKYKASKDEPTLEEALENAKLVGYQDGVKACNEEWLVRLGYKSQYGESQTETEIAKAIVHKMIDDAVIAEDAYPDLRQRMHDAVDEYEPQTERSE